MFSKFFKTLLFSLLLLLTSINTFANNGLESLSGGLKFQIALGIWFLISFIILIIFVFKRFKQDNPKYSLYVYACILSLAGLISYNAYLLYSIDGDLIFGSPNQYSIDQERALRDNDAIIRNALVLTIFFVIYLILDLIFYFKNKKQSWV